MLRQALPSRLDKYRESVTHLQGLNLPGGGLHVAPQSIPLGSEVSYLVAEFVDGPRLLSAQHLNMASHQINTDMSHNSLMLHRRIVTYSERTPLPVGAAQLSHQIMDLRLQSTDSFVLHPPFLLLLHEDLHQLSLIRPPGQKRNLLLSHPELKGTHGFQITFYPLLYLTTLLICRGMIEKAPTSTWSCSTWSLRLNTASDSSSIGQLAHL